MQTLQEIWQEGYDEGWERAVNDLASPPRDLGEACDAVELAVAELLKFATDGEHASVAATFRECATILDGKKTEEPAPEPAWVVEGPDRDGDYRVYNAKTERIANEAEDSYPAAYFSSGGFWYTRSQAEKLAGAMNAKSPEPAPTPEPAPAPEPEPAWKAAPEPAWVVEGPDRDGDYRVYNASAQLVAYSKQSICSASDKYGYQYGFTLERTVAEELAQELNASA